MKKFLILLVIMTEMIACEYDSKIILSEKLPLTIRTENNISIDEFELSEIRNNKAITLLDWEPSQTTKKIDFNQILKEAKNHAFDSFNPNLTYSIYLNTSAGYSFINFKVDTLGNITTITE